MTKRFISAIVFICAVFIAAAYFSTAKAADVTVEFTQDLTLCSDGSPMSANCPVTGYEVWMGTSLTGTAYTLKETVPKANVVTTPGAPPAPPVYSFVTSGVTAGPKCFFLRTASGTKTSGESSRACTDVPAPSPKAPGTVKITIVVAVQ